MSPQSMREGPFSSWIEWMDAVEEETVAKESPVEAGSMRSSSRRDRTSK
jgi:hypothetical protein